MTFFNFTATANNATWSVDHSLVNATGQVVDGDLASMVCLLVFKVFITVTILMLDTIVIVVQHVESNADITNQGCLMQWLSAATIARVLWVNPMEMVTDWYSAMPLGELECRIRGWLYYSLITTYLFCAALLCLDRFVALYFPIFYRNKSNQRVTNIFCACMTVFWLIVHACMQFRPEVIISSVRPIIGWGFCFFIYPQTYLYLFQNLLWMLPIGSVLVLTSLSAIRAITFQLSRRRLVAPELATVGRTATVIGSEATGSTAQKLSRKSVRGLLIVSVQMMFMLCFWSPSFYSLTNAFTKATTSPPELTIVNYWLRQADTLMNSIVYLCMDPKAQRILHQWYAVAQSKLSSSSH